MALFFFPVRYINCTANMKQTITMAGLINQIEMKYKKGHAGCSAEAMLSPIVNQ